MNKKFIPVAVLILALLLLGTVFYYNEDITNRNSKGTNLDVANVIADLNITEIPRDYPYNVPSPLPYNYLYITGSAANTGEDTAYNAGLHVAAYNAAGELEINLTVPLVNGATFGSDAATEAYVSNSYANSSQQLGSLNSQQNLTIEVGIFHEGVVSNWNVTPVWTDSP